MTTVLNTITLRLPWPDKQLRPNARGDWHVHEKPRKQAIKDGGDAVIEARQAGYYELPDRLQMWVTFHPARNGRYDLDNFHAALKHYLDGAFAALGRDDATVEAGVITQGRQTGGRAADSAA